MKNSSLRNHLFDMILGLRENEKDIRNPTFNDLR